MKGSIYKINRARQMIAVKTEDGSFSVFENINEADFELGDKITWRNNSGLGSESMNNLSKNHTVEVYFQNHHVTKDILSAQLREE
ncbi:MAG: hypothetical protein ACRDGA_09980 [Bacteroidota bacterium]